jgi:hypothetical protein
MSTDRKKSFGMRVVKFLLGTDQPSFVVAAAGVSIAWGILVAFRIVYFSTRPTPPLWQTIAFGLALGFFVLPFFFVSISRAIRFENLFKSPWEALATLTAAILSPLAIWRLGASGVNPFLILVGCIAFIVAAFLAARVIVKRSRSL